MASLPGRPDHGVVARRRTVATSDERQIEHLLYRYAELIDAGDYDGLGELLGDAVHTSAAGVTTSGAEAIAEYFTGRTRRFPETGTPRTKHVTTNVIVEVDETGTTATSRSYFTVLQAVPDALALQPIVAGRYHDRFVRDEGGWRFAERRKFVDLEGDLSEHLLWFP
jgi:3-phenylpropionate/cinnamic acid dioxygenase small subunit